MGSTCISRLVLRNTGSKDVERRLCIDMTQNVLARCYAQSWKINLRWWHGEVHISLMLTTWTTTSCIVLKSCHGMGAMFVYNSRSPEQSGQASQRVQAVGGSMMRDGTASFVSCSLFEILLCVCSSRIRSGTVALLVYDWCVRGYYIFAYIQCSNQEASDVSLATFYSALKLISQHAFALLDISLVLNARIVGVSQSHNNRSVGPKDVR